MCKVTSVTCVGCGLKVFFVANAREGTGLPHPPPPASSIPPPPRVSRAHAEVYEPLLWVFSFSFLLENVRLCRSICKETNLEENIEDVFFNPYSFTSTPGHLKHLLAILFRLH